MKKGFTLIRTSLRENLVRIKGFTLIELLVVFTIMGLLVAFGQANYRTRQRVVLVEGAARQLAADMRLAQEYALAGKKPQTLACTSPNSYVGHIFQRMGGSSYAVGARCTGGDDLLEKRVFLPTGVNIAGTATTVFAPLTGRATAAMNIRVYHLSIPESDLRYRVLLNTNGVVEVYREN